MQELDEGDVITKGVTAVDHARAQQSKSRQALKDIWMARLKAPLLALSDAWRAQLNRSLQHFLNMVLVPLEGVGEGRTQVTLVFGRRGMPPRNFTVSAMPKEKRAFRASCHHYLQVLLEVVTKIKETSAMMGDLATAFNLTIMHKKNEHLLHPLVDSIVEAATALGKDRRMQREHQVT